MSPRIVVDITPAPGIAGRAGGGDRVRRAPGERALCECAHSLPSSLLPHSLLSSLPHFSPLSSLLSPPFFLLSRFSPPTSLMCPRQDGQHFAAYSFARTTHRTNGRSISSRFRLKVDLHCHHQKRAQEFSKLLPQASFRQFSRQASGRFRVSASVMF